METHVSETILDEYYLGARAAMLLKKKRVKEKGAITPYHQ